MNKKRKFKRSQIFWLVFYIIGLVGIGFYSISALGGLLFFGSILTIAAVFDEIADDFIWVYLMPITWIFYIFIGIFNVLFWIYDNTIAKINKWLDRDKSHKRFGVVK